MKFEDLEMWKLSKELYKKLYGKYGHREFRDYYFRDQILRASLSISNNIAEGFERETGTEMKRFLYYSKGSSGEVRSMLYLSQDTHQLDEKFFHESVVLCKRVSAMIHSY